MKIAIVGCGMIAAVHLRILGKLMPHASLLLCDVNKVRAGELAAKYPVQNIYTDLSKLLQNERPDSLHVLTPVESHWSVADSALRAGCHVYIEKPVSNTLIQYKRLCNFAKEQERILCVGYSTLGMPVIMKVGKMIDSGDLGKLIAVHCDFMCAWPGNFIPYGDSEHWAYSKKEGILQNMADHPASLVVDVMEPIKEYQASWGRRNILPNDCADLLHVSMTNDEQIGSFTLSIGHGCAHRQAQYYFERGTIIVDLGRQLISAVRGYGPQNFIKKTISGITMGYAFGGGTIKNILDVIRGRLQKEPGIVNLARNFYNAIEGKEELIVGDSTVTQVTGILEKIWSSISTDSRTESLQLVNEQV